MLCKRLTEFFHIHCLTGKPGLLNGECHEMAFHRFGNGAAGFGFGIAETFGEGFHDTRIAATVAAAVSGILRWYAPTWALTAAL